jgi:hypothetical protein
VEVSMRFLPCRGNLGAVVLSSDSVELEEGTSGSGPCCGVWCADPPGALQGEPLVKLMTRNLHN